MPVAPGQTLLHYRLESQIGEGGMGVVWRATDTTLDRAVAVSRDAQGQVVFGEQRIKVDLDALDLNSSGDESYDVAPSGDLIFLQGESRGAAEVRVVLDWLPSLEK